MRLIGPDRYTLTFNARRFDVRASDNRRKFAGRAARGDVKLYVFSSRGQPIYVGVTKQPMRNRLRYGWQAQGRGGYYGYAFRKCLTEATLDIWYLDAPANVDHVVEAETIEAELVYLIRTLGQWPAYQTEIHFHPSQQVHHDLAASILRHYNVGF